MKKIFKDFNNSNFGSYCRNNIGNCSLELVYEGLEEISYIKKFANIFTDPKFKEFFSADIIREQIESEFNKKKNKYDETDPFCQDLIEN